MIWIWSSLCILTNCIVSLWIPIRSFCICVSGYSFIISSNRNSCSNSMNLSRTFFSWISFKKVSDSLVFHQLVIQDSRLFWKEREIHQGKNTIDARYRRGMNAFFFAIFFVCEFLINPPRSSIPYDLIFLSSISIKQKFYSKVSRHPLFPDFLFLIQCLAYEFRKNTEIELKYT